MESLTVYRPPSTSWALHHEKMDEAVHFYRFDPGTRRASAVARLRLAVGCMVLMRTALCTHPCDTEKMKRAAEKVREAERRRREARKRKAALNTAFRVEKKENLDETVIHVA